MFFFATVVQAQTGTLVTMKFNYFYANILPAIVVTYTGSGTIVANGTTPVHSGVWVKIEPDTSGTITLKVPLGQIVSLTELICDLGLFLSIDVSKCVALTNLQIGQSRLTTLDV